MRKLADRSPFNPNFGKVPRLFLDRENIIDDYIDELTNSGDHIDTPYQTTMIYGVRGSGKTSMLTDIINRVKQLDDWIVVDLLNNRSIIDNLIESIQMQSKLNLSKLIQKINDIKIKNFEIKLNSQNTHQMQLLLGIFEKLSQQGKKVLITIDEVASTPEMRDLAMMYQLLIRQNFGIAMIMTGLPENISELKHNKVLTFLLRSNQLELSFLQGRSIEEAFRTNFEKENRQISDSVAVKLTQMTKGYAYAFQLLGYLIWKKTKPGDSIDEKVIGQVIDDYQQKLFDNAYALIYQKLTAVDKQFLKAMAQNNTDEVKLAFIADQTGKPSNYWSTYRKRLVRSQIIKNGSYGFVSFKLPFFKEFLLEEESFEKYDFLKGS